MGDIALIWSDDNLGDILTAEYDLQTDEGLRTAVIISLFSDRRASVGEELPAGEPSRRGWWGDVDPEVPGDVIGSRLWLIFRAKQLPNVLARANEYAREALQWLIDDKVASRVDVLVESTEFQRLDIQVTIYRAGKDAVYFRFGSAWANETAADADKASSPPAANPVPRLSLDFTSGVLPGAVQFTRATVGTYFDASGFLRTAAAGVPRFDYDPMTKEIRGLLIEQESTNLILRSINLAVSPWTTTGYPAVPSSELTLRGDATAFKIVPAAGTGLSGGGFAQGVAKTAVAQRLTFSVFAKAAEYDRIRIYMNGQDTVNASARGDWRLADGSLIGTNIGSAFSDLVVKAEPFPNGWWRFSITATTDAHTNVTCRIYSLSSSTTVADGVSGILVWLPQLEQADAPTSVIETNTTTVTRAADVARMPSVPWHNPLGGCYVVEADVRALGTSNPANSAPAIFSMSKGTSMVAADSLAARIAQPFTMQCLIGNSGVFKLVNFPGATTIGAREKIAIAGDASGQVACRNGAAPRPFSDARWPASVDTLWIGSETGGTRYWNGHIRRIQHYRERLSNDVLQQLTA